MHNPETLAIFGENIEKEKLLRLKWFGKNLDRIKLNTACKSNQSSGEVADILDKFKRELFSLPSINKSRMDNNNNREKVYIDKVAQQPMRPVAPEVMELLYSSNNKEGTCQYLKQRCKESPDEKYYFPECTSWQYGWRLKDRMLPSLQRKGRVAVIKASFYRKSGVGPDPLHYTNPSYPVKSICKQ